MEITKYYITHVKYGISTVYLENDKRVEFDSWEKARSKVIKLEARKLDGYFAWKKDVIDV